MLQKSIFERMSEGYDQAWQLFIRPRICEYSVNDLGPVRTYFDDNFMDREDFTVTNKFYYKMECSVFLPNGKSGDIPCIIYLHSQTGCRLESLNLREKCAEMGFALCSFDFSGCGHSEGKIISH